MASEIFSRLSLHVTPVFAGLHPGCQLTSGTIYFFVLSFSLRRYIPARRKLGVIYVPVRSRFPNDIIIDFTPFSTTSTLLSGLHSVLMSSFIRPYLSGRYCFHWRERAVREKLDGQMDSKGPVTEAIARTIRAKVVLSYAGTQDNRRGQCSRQWD